MSLIPITTILEERRYNYGELVVKEGEDASHFFIVAKGRFKIIKQLSIVR